MSKQTTRCEMSSAAALAVFVLCCFQLPASCRSQPPPNPFMMTSATQEGAGRDQNATRRTNAGRAIRFAVLESVPYFTRSSRDGATGFIADVIDGVSRLMDIQYGWPVERVSGKRRKDGGNSTGIISKLLNHEADAGVIAINQHQSIDHRLLTTHQLIIESTLSLIVNPDAQGQGYHFYLEDLLNDTSIGLGHVTNSRVELLLRRSELPVHQALWHRLSSAVAMPGNRTMADRELPSGFQKDIAFTSLSTGVQHVAENSRFILIAESSDALFSTLSAPGCRLTVHDQFFPVAQYHFVVPAEHYAPRNTNGGDRQFSRSRTPSPQWLIRQLDSALGQLHDTGVIQQLHDKWWTASNGNTDCSEPSTSGPSWATGGRSPPSSPVGRQPPRLDDDWRARERIFFESPLRRSTTSTMTTTTAPPPSSTSEAARVASTIHFDSFSSVSLNDITYPVSRPEVNRVLDMLNDGNETTAPSTAMTDLVLPNQPVESEHRVELVPVTAMTTNQTVVTAYGEIFETHQHAMATTRKPKKTTTTKPPRPHRHRQNQHTSGRRLLPTPAVTDRSFDEIIDQSLANSPLFDNGDALDDGYITAEETVVGDTDTESFYHHDGTEQEMNVKDHWMRRQVSVDDDVESPSAMDATSTVDDSANRAEAATGNAACTSRGRRTLVGAFLAIVVLFRFR